MTQPIIAVLPLYDREKKSLWMHPGYFEGVRRAGGLPLMLPLEMTEAEIDRVLPLCGGVLLTGGQDVDPALYGEAASPLCGEISAQRDTLEAAVLSAALKADLPVLGICRGLQFMNVRMGGTLYQDLPTQRPESPVLHRMTPPYDRAVHRVFLQGDTPLGRLLGAAELGVNSLHHQAVRTLAPALRAMALSEDGLVEAVYRPDKRFFWAVQWHPELSYSTDADSRAIFRAFIEAAQSRSNN